MGLLSMVQNNKLKGLSRDDRINWYFIYGNNKPPVFGLTYLIWVFLLFLVSLNFDNGSLDKFLVYVKISFAISVISYVFRLYNYFVKKANENYWLSSKRNNMEFDKI